MDTEISTKVVAILVVLALFILSLITERICGFIKNQFKSLYLKVENNLELEKKREKKLLILSSSIGIVIALICNADFFTFIAGKGIIAPVSSINDFTLKSVTGCIITGLFLGQGAKLFHDLLDALLCYKNAKKALCNKCEMENQLLKSLTADEMTNAATPEQRDDDLDNNL